MDRFFIVSEVSFIIIMAWLSVFWWHGKFPSIDSFKKTLEVLDSKGGNIAVLALFALLGIFTSIRLMYYILQLSVDGKLQQDNSFALLTVQFMTNTITGGFIGAMLKTMSGSATVAPVTVPTVPVPDKTTLVVESSENQTKEQK